MYMNAASRGTVGFGGFFSCISGFDTKHVTVRKSQVSWFSNKAALSRAKWTEIH